MKNFKNIKIKKVYNQELNFSLLVLTLAVTCFVILVIATFTQLNVYTILNWHLKSIFYVPQIPVVFFIAGLLGKKYGILSVCLYIITGLFLAPVFALGGGLEYILNMNFGYILGFIPAIYLAAGRIEIKKSFLNILIGCLIGLLTIHIIGICYMFLVLTFERTPFYIIQEWIATQSLNTLMIDFIFGLAALSLGDFTKNILKKIA